MKVLKRIDIARKLKEFFKGSFEANKLLCGYTSIKIGGRASIFLEPENNLDLARAVEFLNSLALPFRVIGNGTNLLIDEGLLDFAVIKLSSLFFKTISVQKDVLFVRGGVSLPYLLNFSIKKGISGFEFLAGIPGTAGGALVMNAGIRNPECSQKGIENASYLSISDSLIKIEVMDHKANIFELNKNDAGFVYRGSKLKGLIILGAYFKVKTKPPELVAEHIKSFLEKRRICQEIGVHSAGCVFKNPIGKDVSAGALIERAKLKGYSMGQAQVSDIHANFILNKGNATFSQVRQLMDRIEEKVWQDSGIKLEPEVEIWNN